MILLAALLTIAAPECNKIDYLSNTITISQCGGAQPSPTPKPTPPPSIGTKLDKPLTFAAKTYGLDFISLPHGAKQAYYFDVPTPTNRLTIATNDRSGINLCAKLKLTVTPQTGIEPRSSEGGADMTIRYFSPPTIPAGRYVITVEDRGDIACNQKYLIYWQY